MNVLGQIAEKGDAAVVAAACARLEDENGDVRAAAVRVLGKVAEEGDALAIAAVCARLEDTYIPKLYSNGHLRRFIVCMYGSVQGYAVDV